MDSIKLFYLIFIKDGVCVHIYIYIYIYIGYFYAYRYINDMLIKSEFLACYICFGICMYVFMCVCVCVCL